MAWSPGSEIIANYTLVEGISSERSLKIRRQSVKRVAISYTYLDLFKICNGLINVPSVIFETIDRKLDVEARERAYLCHE